jgi:hypothetical protein
MEKHMKHRTEIIRTIDLDHEQMWVFDGGPNARIRVLHGATWLTGEGQADDTILHRGSERALHPGRTLIEGLMPSRVQIVERTERGGVSMRQWWRSVQRFVTRQQFGAIASQPQA